MLALSVTERLKSSIAEVGNPASMTDDLILEGKKTILNTLACGIGAARLPEFITLASEAEPGPVPILGTQATSSSHFATLVNGTLAHFEDFDDTHAKLRTHGGATVVTSALTATFQHSCSGSQLIQAVVAGMEISYRVAASLMPQHHELGWHPTGTFGVIGSCVSAGSVAGLSSVKQYEAMKIASGLTVGLRSVFGTPAKPVNAGVAATNGLFAAHLASHGQSMLGDPITGEGGYFDALGGLVEVDSLSPRNPADWEFLRNTYKPYPCGKVVHSVIDAGKNLHGRVIPSEISNVVVRCHPAVLDVAGIAFPSNSLEAKFSCSFGFAIALVRGSAEISDFEPDVIHSESIQELLGKITCVPEPTFPSREMVHVRVFLTDGRTVDEEVEFAFGSLLKPMSMADLEQKAFSLIALVDEALAEPIIEAVKNLETMESARDLLLLARPTRLAPNVGARAVEPVLTERLGLTAETGLAGRVASFLLEDSPPEEALAAVRRWEVDIDGRFLSSFRTERESEGGLFSEISESAGPRERVLEIAFRLSRDLALGIPHVLYPALAVMLASSPDQKLRLDGDQLKIFAVVSELGLRFERDLALGENWDSAGTVGCLLATVTLGLSRPNCSMGDLISLMTLSGTQVGGVGSKHRGETAAWIVAVSARAAFDSWIIHNSGLVCSTDILGARRGLFEVLGRETVTSSTLGPDGEGNWLLCSR